MHNLKTYLLVLKLHREKENTTATYIYVVLCSLILKHYAYIAILNACILFWGFLFC